MFSDFSGNSVANGMAIGMANALQRVARPCLRCGSSTP